MSLCEAVSILGLRLPVYSWSYGNLPARLRENEPFVLKVHGDIHHLEDIVLTNDSYRSILNDPRLNADLTALLGVSMPLFLGCGMDDLDLKLIL